LIDQCTTLPLSIVIVGIGKGEELPNGKNWETMQELDNELKNKRDLIKFVEYEKYINFNKQKFTGVVL